MPEPSNLSLFIAATLVLLAIPGPAVLYIVARSIDQGRTAGLVSVLGTSTGSLVHITAAALGLSAILMSSATVFNAVKYVGAAYLIYLGLTKLFGNEESAPEEASANGSLSRAYYQGIVVNVFNPKTALFFFAFLPQFVNVARGHVTAQILFLGTIFVVLAMLSDSAWALMAGAVGRRLKGSTRFLRTQRYFAGGVYLALGMATAFAGGSRRK